MFDFVTKMVTFAKNLLNEYQRKIDRTVYETPKRFYF